MYFEATVVFIEEIQTKNGVKVEKKYKNELKKIKKSEI